MKYAIISDIHSNLEALDAVIEDIKSNNVDEIICLGDIVGYGADPRACLDIVRSVCKKILMGNHDHAAIGLTNVEFFNYNARFAIEWTISNLKRNDIDFLKDLPLTLKQDRIVCTHANLYKPDEWGYILDEFSAFTTFKKMKDADICFIGHSHVPIAFETKKHELLFLKESFFDLNKETKYIVNVGSVGQPRDGNPKAAYVIYDDEQKRVFLKRISYDVEKAGNKIIKEGLPSFLAERIRYGR